MPVLAFLFVLCGLWARTAAAQETGSFEPSLTQSFLVPSELNRADCETIDENAKLTEALASKASDSSKLPLVSRDAVPAQNLLEVGVSELEIVARFPEGEVRISNFEDVGAPGKAA